MSSHIVSIKAYVIVWASLLALLLLTLGIASLNLHPFNAMIALTIAVMKMLLIILYFMHVRYSTRLTWIFVVAGFLWLLIMITLTMSDYLTRGMIK